jgi:hypothetical protein
MKNLRWGLIASIIVLTAPTAMADAIDGDWCSPREARHVSISGSKVTTWSGRQTTGNYSRHAFSYIVPAGDPDAGDAVSLQLLNEEEARVTIADGQSETWHRCQLNV